MPVGLDGRHRRSRAGRRLALTSNRLTLLPQYLSHVRPLAAGRALLAALAHRTQVFGISDARTPIFSHAAGGE